MSFLAYMFKTICIKTYVSSIDKRLSLGLKSVVQSKIVAGSKFVDFQYIKGQFDI